MDLAKILLDLHTNHSLFRENSLNDRFFTHSGLVPLIAALGTNDTFEVIDAGFSYENRAIRMIKTGLGPLKIMLWSQMHGDEPTATMALFDLFNFLSAPPDDYLPIRNAILEACTLYFIPMVNPDGAERFTRRNAQGIDINRDFRQQQSPEGRLLRRLRDEIKPHFAFNLHDQTLRWSAGISGNPATISVLAPAVDEELTIDAVRKRAMQICSGLNGFFQQLLPGHVGRFNDEYEPRSFGDNFQAAGTSTILIEAGGFPGDDEKQFMRQLLFSSFVYCLYSLASDAWKDETVERYFAIPKNRLKHFSILLRNCAFSISGNSYVMDLGLVMEACQKPGLSLLFVDEAGDLTDFYGYEEIDATGYTFTIAAIPIPGTPATLILQNELGTILSVENGVISRKTGTL